ncbi:hypothetical protein J1614_011140 [Plenodomus biglobosus]|nr:hypothetical protein J1614_011140 [Plenodomus biglobosus]
MVKNQVQEKAGPKDLPISNFETGVYPLTPPIYSLWHDTSHWHDVCSMEMGNNTALLPERREPFNDLVPRFLKELQSASDSQNALASTRQQLLIQRARVQGLGRKVQLSRIDASDAGAVFMNRLREYMSNQGIGFPVNVRDAFDRYEELRTDFGVIESDYLQAERELSGKEWIFMDQETNFYQYELPIPIFEEWAGLVASQSTHEASNKLQPQPLVRTHNMPRGLQTSAIQFPETKELKSMDAHLSTAIGSSDIDRDRDYVLTELGSWQEVFENLRQDQMQRIDCEEASEVPMSSGTPMLNVLPPFVDEYCSVLEQMSNLHVEAQRMIMKEMAFEPKSPYTVSDSLAVNGMLQPVASGTSSRSRRAYTDTQLGYPTKTTPSTQQLNERITVHFQSGSILKPSRLTILNP